MVQAVILDVDGVIVGEKKGFNFPQPHADIVNAFRTIHAKGIPLVLCTGKFVYAIKDFVIAAHLDNPHIADGGAIIVDPIHAKIISSYSIDKEIGRQIVQFCLENHVYLELSSPYEYYIQKGTESELTFQHAKVIGKEPISTSLLDIIDKEDIIKIMPVVKNEEEKVKYIPLFNKFSSKVHIAWSSHPSLLPHQFVLITAIGVSKLHASEEVAKYLGIPMEHILGIGDNTSDWLFMEHCGYAGAMGNASDELKRLVFTKGNKGYIGRSVDEHGILDIFNHFGV